MDELRMYYFEHKLRDQIQELLQKAFNIPDLRWVDEWIKNECDNIQLEKKHNIFVTIDKPYSGRENNYVLSADYDLISKITTIVFNERMINKINFSNKFTRQLLSSEIKHFLTHENTHEQQDQGNFSKQPYQTTDKVSTKEYIQQYQELPAFAREIAYELSEIGFNDSESAVIAVIKDDERIQNIDDYKYIVEFKEIGGKVYRRFLGEIYRYFKEL